mmetsp:Transcript_15993/g.48056  ORF Transcript_15993/g.48056 Transcript_15993/m.48056 type:complete len:119 (+) Transcript_15993:1609-1965(+)
MSADDADVRAIRTRREVPLLLRGGTLLDESSLSHNPTRLPLQILEFRLQASTHFDDAYMVGPHRIDLLLKEGHLHLCGCKSKILLHQLELSMSLQLGEILIERNDALLKLGGFLGLCG